MTLGAGGGAALGEFVLSEVGEDVGDVLDTLDFGAPVKGSGATGPSAGQFSGFANLAPAVHCLSVGLMPSFARILTVEPNVGTWAGHATRLAEPRTWPG